MVMKMNIRWMIFCCLFACSLFFLSSLSGCVWRGKKADFDPKTCFDTIPEDVRGLTILTGPRTRGNIIRDMVHPICQGYALFEKTACNDPDLKPGTITFRVVVEYTGEVNNVTIERTTIRSRAFLREVTDFIMDTDFVYWKRTDEDTVFLYPVTFEKQDATDSCF